MLEQVGFTGPPEHRHDYEVVELLASSGGQGYLFAARLTSDRFGPELLGADVALKQLITGAVGADRVEELAEVIRGRRHPSLAHQLEVFRGPAPAVAGVEAGEADLLYVATLWVPGQTLAARAAGAPIDDLLRWVSHVGHALDYLHAELHDGGPVLHRDVKPSNIIVTDDGRAVLIDPGVARVLPADATGSPYGSAGFRPPETEGDPSAGGAASDRWQLGTTLVAALLGAPPSPHEDRAGVRARLVRQLRGHVRDAGTLTDEILTMRQWDPSRRPSSAGDWATGLLVRRARSGGTSGPGRKLVAAGPVALALVVGMVAGSVIDGGGEDGGSEDGGGIDGGGEEEASGRTQVAEAISTPQFSRTVSVLNQVTSGSEMREDTPSYLSTLPASSCKRDGCALEGTDVNTGAELDATCQTLGPRVTNGDDTTPADDDNPGLADSRLWYGIRWSDGRFGFLAEVWIQPDDRGGLDLPLC